MKCRHRNRPVKKLTVGELERELDMLKPLIRDIVNAKQARIREIEKELKCRNAAEDV